jgi:hypothetical protein
VSRPTRRIFTRTTLVFKTIELSECSLAEWCAFRCGLGVGPASEGPFLKWSLKDLSGLASPLDQLLGIAEYSGWSGREEMKRGRFPVGLGDTEGNYSLPH